jgi:hypothetical protein
LSVLISALFKINSLWEKQYGREARHLLLKKSTVKAPDNSKAGSNKRKAKDAGDEASTENLHPSWVAKKAQKPVIADFQGKKVVFGDDDEDDNAKSGGSQRGSRTAEDSNSNGSNVRKRQKVDNGSNNAKSTFEKSNSFKSAPRAKPQPVKVDESLHPSWVAKKQQAEAAKALQGTNKKIVFNDDDD